MKTRLLATFFVLLMTQSTVQALQVGWINPEARRFSVELEAGRVTERLLNVAPIQNAGQRLYYRSTSGTARIGYSLTDRLGGYIRGGGADISGMAALSQGLFTIDGSYEPAYGGGVQGVIFRGQKWSVAADGQVFQHGNHDNKAFPGGKSRWREWQVGIQLQEHYHKLHPYFGVAYSDVWVDWTTSVTGRHSVKERLGVYGGIGAELSEDWIVNLEGHLGDQSSYSGSLKYRF